MTVDAEETRLVAAARGGDAGAFGELVRRHEQAVRRLALGMLADEDEAEDAAQEVFVKAFRSLGKYRGDALFSTWLHRITVNQCMDVLRRRKRWRWLSLDAPADEQGREPPSPATSPEQATRGVEAKDLLRSLLKGIPADHRAILLLRELEGLSYVEIAKTLDITLDAVRARLRRARQTALEVARHSGAFGGV